MRFAGVDFIYLSTEHAEDLAALVAHDTLLDLVIQNRDGEAALVLRI